MIFQNNFGDRIEVNPTHWWNILDWLEIYKFWRRFKNAKMTINTKGWKCVQMESKVD